MDNHRHPGRTELITETSVILWDEFFSNDKMCFNAVYRSYNGLRGKVFIAFGDDGQIAPVVVNGKRLDTSRASIITHPLWRKFTVFKFTKNLRLLGIERSLDMSNEEHVQFYERQKLYATILEQIREGNKFSDEVQFVYNDLATGTTHIRLPTCKYITDKNEAVRFLYPHGFGTENLHDRAVLCATNEDVDEWNSTVQDLNPNVPRTYVSHNEFKDIDDPKGILKSMLTEDACMFYHQNGVPDHRMTFKVGDICFVMRTLNRKEKLANNTRVIITQLHDRIIKVFTIEDFPREFIIPRIRFHVKLKFGGFTLIRTQFPLRLAYAMTKNKSQGQSIPVSLDDVRHPPFSHGHLYVSTSRATDVDMKAFFCNIDQVMDGAVVVANVVYPELLLP